MKRTLSILLAIVMLLGLLPTVALAATQEITISTQPVASTSVAQNGSAALTVDASATEGATPTYQWYSCSDTDKSGAQPVENAVYPSFTVPTTAAGVYFYYVTVGATNSEGTVFLDSNVSTVTVTAALADTIAADVQDIAVKTEGGSEDAETIQEGQAYQVQVTVKNTGTDPVGPDVIASVYEVRSDIDIVLIDQEKPTGELGPEASAMLSFAWTPDMAGSCTLRAEVWTDTGGTNVQLDHMELPATVAEAAVELPAVPLAGALTDDVSDPLFGLDFDYGVIEEFAPLAAPASIAADFPDGQAFILPFAGVANFSSTDTVLLNAITKQNIDGVTAISSNGSQGGRYNQSLNLSVCAYSPETVPEWRSMFGTELYAVKLSYQSEVHYLLLSESYTEGEDVYTVARMPGYSTSNANLPKSATYLRGDNAVALQYTITNLTVGAAGAGTVTYQWFVSVADNVEGGMALPGANSPAYMPYTTHVGTSYYYLVITNTLEQGNTPSHISVTTTPMTMITVMDVPGWDSGEPQDIPLGLHYENGASLNKITISGGDVVGASGAWKLDSSTQMYDYTYDVLLSPDSVTGDTITASFNLADQVVANAKDGVLYPCFSQYSFRADGAWKLTAPLQVVLKLGPDLKSNHTEYSAALTNEGAAIEVFLYRSNVDWNPGGMKFTLNFTVEYKDPAPEMVQSLSIATPPDKTGYLYGERFNPAGMVVMAHLQDESEAEVRGYTLSPSGPLTLEDDKVTVSYGGKSVEQEISVSSAPIIGRAEMKNGQFILEQPLYDEHDAHVVVLYGEEKGLMDITVPAGVGVTLNGTAQTVTEEGSCSLSLNTSGGQAGTANTIALGYGDEASTYTVTCHSQLYSGMPDAVTDYLCINSQYTNGRYVGTFLQSYGLNGVSSLVGSGDTTGGMYSGPTSLGNFGGYITYYYKDPIYDNPNNPYGIDFVVCGNSVDGGPGFAEPGQVWVSENGEDWYALAGALHYDDCIEWHKTFTYSRTSNGKTRLTADGVTELSDYFYPLKKNYPLYAWPEGAESSITLGGVFLSPQSGVNEYGNTVPSFPDFGYADVGQISTRVGNPYLGRDANGFLRTPDVMDLAWAVDASGQPVSFPDGIHYIKVQTANNIDNGGIGEKSTEINMVQVAGASPNAAGKTSAPGSITVDGQAVPLHAGVSSYNVSVTGGFTVLVDAGSAANVYINGSRTRNATYSEIPAHEMLRVIVQEGMQEPAIYYLTLTDTGETPVTSHVTLDANGGKVNDRDSVTLTYDAGMAGSVFPTPTRSGYTFVGWKGAAQAYYAAYSAELTGDVTLKAIWKETPLNPEPEKNPITVTFRLIGSTLSDGDVDLGEGDEGYHGAKYVTWIPTRTYTMQEGDLVYDLFVKAMADADLKAIGQDQNYVKTIYAPAVCGGYELSEFTNGRRSGWMYTVNGEHPLYGLKQLELEAGDRVIWHYVDDYAYEVSDWDKLGGIGYPAMDDSTYWNSWLKAADIRPTTDSGSNTKTPESGEATVKPSVKAVNGTAAVTLSADDLAASISNAKENGSGAIVIAPEITGTAKKVSVEVPKASVSSIASETNAGLTVQTPVGTVTLPNSALDSIASQAAGGSVTVSLDKVDTKLLSAEQQTAAGSSAVYDISVMSGGTKISSFGGSSIAISLPYTLKSGEDPSGVTVWYLDDSGKLQQMTAAYDKATGLATFTTPHLSYYVVGYTAPWANPFSDVKSTDWFFDAVEYASRNSLMSGTSSMAFEPNTHMTRAMLVTVLYRLEGSPAVTGTNSFTDVKSGQWYTNAVIWANANGIVEGYGNGVFGTNDNMTREQMAMILYKYTKLKGYDVTKTTDLKAYTDASAINFWAQAGMTWANAERLIAGRTATTLVPGGTATRAEVATILQRFVENIVK